VSLDVTLNWTAGLAAKLHYVHFGDNFDDVNNAVGGVPTVVTSYSPGTLEKGKVCYWRVDESDGLTTYTGDVWSFTTIPDIPITDPNLMGWWKLDEGEGTTAVDWSGHDRHGGFEGDPQWALGHDGGALEFDGDDHVDTGYTDNLANYTIACWVISPAAPSDDSPSGPLHRERNYQFNWNHGNEIFRGAAAMRIEPDWHAASYMPLEANTWYHLAATYDGSSLNAYRDGVLITSNSVPSGLPDSEAGTLKLGRHATAVQYFTGTVDEARVYDRALTAEEITEAMRGDTSIAWAPSPSNGSTADIFAATTLTWSPGDNAVQHDVYFGTDIAAVDAADASDTTGVYRGRQGLTSYTPPEGVQMNSGPYYWRIDEFNTDGTISTGKLWSFTVGDYGLVEDFESYNDIAATEPGSNLVYLTWIDGFDNPATNGSTMGYPTGASMETDIVHGGRQSAPVMYNNVAVSISEVTRTFAVPQNWTVHGLTTLSLWFHGAVTNIGGQMYVKINGVEVAYSGSLGRPVWQVWNIDLTSLSVNLQSVTSLLIGIRGPGSTGTLIFDDIRLLQSAPEPAEEIWLEAEAAVSITPPMKVYNDPLASAGRYIGTDAGIGNESDTPPADGVATYTFTVQGGIYKIVGRVIIPDGDSFWVRIPSATNLTPGEDPDNPGTGWVRWSDPPDGDTWHWEDVFSGDHGGETANWTLPAGQHTLEIAHREDGALLDAIVITDNVD
jgi:hypothetical protein